MGLTDYPFASRRSALLASNGGGTRKPVYQQIAEQVNESIVTGQLRHGDKLPTIRALAEELGVNRDTVALNGDAKG